MKIKKLVTVKFIRGEKGKTLNCAKLHWNERSCARRDKWKTYAENNIRWRLSRDRSRAPNANYGGGPG